MKANTLQIKYKYCDDFGHVSKYEYNTDELEEKELVHEIAQSGTVFLCASGWDLPMEDQLGVTEWHQLKYERNRPSEYNIGKQLMITLKDPEAEVTVAVWDGEHFEGYEYDEVIAWAYLPVRYDNTTIWY